MIGRTFSHYRILEKLGEGGMGIVWKALDTKLDREVALKMLPEQFVRDPERLARFEREARVLATLDHPHIASIYGIEEAGDQQVLVLQLVAGETLEQRMVRGPVPGDEALRLALQISSALEAAHERGVVHRDLKPANIKLTQEDEVMVLDFGLAKAMDQPAGPSDPSDAARSPTLTAAPSSAGMLMGTAAYMSPEQARGNTVDRRCDVWAFGVVLWEMLCGKKLFDGKTTSDILAGVLRQEISFDPLPADSPPALRRLIERCLQRDHRRRLRDIGDARLEIEDLLAGGVAGEDLPAALTGSKRAASRSWWPALGAGVVLTLGVMWGLGGLDFAPREEPRPLRVFSLVSEGRSPRDTAAISPDGSMVAYTVERRLRIRDLDNVEPRIFQEVEVTQPVFWSPDSRFVAVISGKRLLKVDARSGRTHELARLPSGGEIWGGCWGADGYLVVALGAGSTGSLHRIPETGGAPELFLEPDGEADEMRYATPVCLPDGALAYTALFSDLSERIVVQRGGRQTTVYESSAVSSGGVVQRLASTADGHLVVSLYAGDEEFAIFALPPAARRPEGGKGILPLARRGKNTTVAADGSLVFERVVQPEAGLAWVEVDGTIVETIALPIRNIWNPTLSPDGTRMTILNLDGSKGDLWVRDLETGKQVALYPKGVSPDQSAWSPTGERLVFAAGGNLHLVPADGSRAPVVVWKGEGPAFFPDWTPDGQSIVFHAIDPEGQRDLWVLSLDDDGSSRPLLETPFDEGAPRIAPDGRTVVYQSNETGRWEIYVRRFPEGDERWQVSVDGGKLPQWDPRGDRLYYIRGDTLMEVRVELDPFRASTPRPLFTGRELGTKLADDWGFFFTPAPGGRLLLVTNLLGGMNEVILVENMRPGDPPLN
jgi:hypothetical protein